MHLNYGMMKILTQINIEPHEHWQSLSVFWSKRYTIDIQTLSIGTKRIKLMGVFYLQICSRHKNSYPYDIFILRNFWTFLIMKFWFCKANWWNLIFLHKFDFFHGSRSIFGNFRSIHHNFKSSILILTTISTKPIKFW